MRFEIGPGGGFVILVGLLGLSAAVFFLGMISGREMAQSEQGQSQVASVYPMPVGAPPAAPSQAAAPAAAPARPPAQTASSENAAPSVQPKPALRHKAQPRPALASIPPPRPSVPDAEDSDTDSSASSNPSARSDEADTGEADTGGDESTASVPRPSARTHRRGYNIVIDAAMDRPAADRMASRLLGLGYTSHIVPTQINGQTWYRVQVGPYPTSDDAQAAQTQLRAAYTARYVNHSGTASARTSGGAARAGANAASAGSANTDASDSGAADTGPDDSSAGDSAPSD